MPLLIITGYPCSGKSTVTQRILKFLEESRDPKPVITVISDDSNSKFGRHFYDNPSLEKDHRGWLRSEVQRLLTKDSVLICDSLNYIKGFRYELFCVGKLVKSTYAVVHCDVTSDCVHWLNGEKEEKLRYPSETLDALIARYEAPEHKNRWDSPLITVSMSQNDPPRDVKLPLEEIAHCLFEGKPLAANLSTQTQPLASSNYLYELDKQTQHVVQSLIGQQSAALVGDWLMVADSEEKLQLTKKWTAAELSRLRRQFINYTKTHPIDNNRDTVATLFVRFINSFVN